MLFYSNDFTMFRLNDYVYFITNSQVVSNVFIFSYFITLFPETEGL